MRGRKSTSSVPRSFLMDKNDQSACTKCGFFFWRGIDTPVACKYAYFLCTHTQRGFPTGERNRLACISVTSLSRFHICAYFSYFSPPDMFFEEEEIKGIWRNWKGKREFAIRGGKKKEFRLLFPPLFPTLHPHIFPFPLLLFFSREISCKGQKGREGILRGTRFAKCVCEFIYFF